MEINSESFQRPTIEQTAHHEAGHAIVNLALGRKVTSIDIRPNVSNAGNPACASHWREGQEQTIEPLIITAYAGYFGEQLTGSVFETGLSSDYSSARKWAWRLIHGEEGMDEYFGYWKHYWGSRRILIPEVLEHILKPCFEESKRLVDHHSSTIRQFARHLQEHHYMTEQEAEDLWSARKT